LIIGIDATNLRGGGGITHLVELLRAVQPSKLGIERIVVWGSISTLNTLENQPWLKKCNPLALNKGLFQRTLWQRYHLSQEARHEECDVLFVPGGSYGGNYHPVVTMSQNLLPFEMRELLRYGFSLNTLKFLLLRFTQSRSFKNTEGVIFLTEYARDVVMRITGNLSGKTVIIPHGLNPRFNRKPMMQRAIADYNAVHPYRILYVSVVDHYKHQWHVVEAIAILRKQGFPIELDLVGPANSSALKRLNKTIDSVDPDRCWVHYHGHIPYIEMQTIYTEVDMGIWASTCETFGIILLETMAVGLPVACSNKPPMPEVVGEAGVYFDPEQPDDIARALYQLIESPQLRQDLSQASYERAQHYSWQRCADETLSFLASVAKQYK